MGAPAPLDVYRQFQSFLINGEYSRLAEVADMDGYTEHCVGLTDMAPTEHDVVQNADMLVIRGSYEVTHSGEFLGVPPTGRRVSYDWVDMYRVTGGRIVWRYLLCDWKGLRDQLTAP